MEQTGAITGYIDVAQIALYVFWAFFAGLIFYLRREDKREGYPLISERSGQFIQGLPNVPSPKTFNLSHGGVQTAPRKEPTPRERGVPIATFPGAPIEPRGSAMFENIGPGSWVDRADVPDPTFLDGSPRILPMRVKTDITLEAQDPDPRGFAVVGADGLVAGHVRDLWVDWAEMLVRYLEVELTGSSSRHVLLPTGFAVIKSGRKLVRVNAIMSDQFVGVPALRNPDVVTLREEDRIMGYYGGGLFYARPGRGEPLL